MFEGKRLTTLLKLNGYSEKELAVQLGVSEQIVYEIENMSATPNVFVISKLASIFHVTPRYFLSKEDLPRKTDVSKITCKFDNINSRENELIYLGILNKYVNFFESQVSVPSERIRDIKKKTNYYWIMNNEQSAIKMERIANFVRKRLDLSQNQDLMYSLEMSGIYIAEKELGAGIDAYSATTKDGRSLIILGNQKKSAVRRNFDLAHELGHLLLHDSIDMDQLETAEYTGV